MPLRYSIRLLVIAATAVIGVNLLGPAPARAAGKHEASHAASSRIAWLPGKSEAAVNAAFAQARKQGRPVLLYWGAAWCPPCNQLKATLFNRQDFIVLTQAVVPVYLDGDLPGAQKLGSRFKVVGYPTMILFSSLGTEITRLPGESDARRIIESLQSNLAGGRAAKTLLADAQAGKLLSASEWDALAFYSWDTDEAQLVAGELRAQVLGDLAQRGQSVNPPAATRLWLKSLMAGEAEGGAGTPEALPAQRQRLSKLLGDPEAARQVADVLMEGARTILRSLHAAADPESGRLVGEYDAALLRLQNDRQLSRADQTSALIARIELARLDIPEDRVTAPLPASLRDEVGTMARRMDAEITDGYERQAVITAVAHLLAKAGLWADSDALLLANLKRSHSPYYLMSQLGGNARKLGRHAEALDWYERAYQASQGPATRIQWGANYVVALLDLAPNDSARIEKAATGLFLEAERNPDAYYGRSSRSLKRVIGKLASWSLTAEQDAVFERLRVRHGGACRKIAADDPRRPLCVGIWAAS